MNNLASAVTSIVDTQRETKKPLAIILAGHNGSGKSTMWRKMLAGQLQIPLINADRMMLSILPEPNSEGALADWALDLRDNDQNWMLVAQRGVRAFVGHAMRAQVPFAMETVFSHWKDKGDGSFESKVDMIRDIQAAGYFVLLFFVGLTDTDLSILRVRTRVAEHGHAVDETKLRERFPRTQVAIRHALDVADASVLVDNSRDEKRAFSVCVVRRQGETLYDIRNSEQAVPSGIAKWLDIVCPKEQPL
ncbi:zeta toxin family protein [Agrobacterium larrymoorei]|uniref:Toxin n=1 Tax=Agrobacterium larrymoorei TaxID=160699 RepID=A0A4D7E6C7_9HYPH|nr:zeta toxin family protein [Agrobacterium larrymoorei]QCJ00901.1 toxin [Agrobacterium larrymoorei]QYA10237.1 zeta toxin family protein [Agrobacterium larrymoorei]